MAWFFSVIERFFQELTMSDLDKYQKNIPDSRLRATQTIWGFATGMFVLCVPLVAIARSAIFIPATVAVWGWHRNDRRMAIRFSLSATVVR